jgi:O-acetyl-ADP-ribose deacetylase (regulator of RNase III)
MEPDLVERVQYCRVRITCYVRGKKVGPAVEEWVNWASVMCVLDTITDAWPAMGLVNTTALREKSRKIIAESYEYERSSVADSVDLPAMVAGILFRAHANPHFGLSPQLIGH